MTRSRAWRCPVTTVKASGHLRGRCGYGSWRSQRRSGRLYGKLVELPWCLTASYVLAVIGCRRAQYCARWIDGRQLCPCRRPVMPSKWSRNHLISGREAFVNRGCGRFLFTEMVSATRIHCLFSFLHQRLFSRVVDVAELCSLSPRKSKGEPSAQVHVPQSECWGRPSRQCCSTLSPEKSVLIEQLLRHWPRCRGTCQHRSCLSPAYWWDSSVLTPKYSRG
mmetsp:Transcript_114299/g.262278  ORF Transcript_114299/g.262278 Transcript_114299/m.262278 type:complete len:221 (-) Transcript_114299:485-1147(-)